MFTYLSLCWSYVVLCCLGGHAGFTPVVCCPVVQMKSICWQPTGPCWGYGGPMLGQCWATWRFVEPIIFMQQTKKHRSTVQETLHDMARVFQFSKTDLRRASFWHDSLIDEPQKRFKWFHVVGAQASREQRIQHFLLHQLDYGKISVLEDMEHQVQ